MRKLLLVVVLVAVLLVGDLAAKSVAESAVESGVRSRVQGVGAVDAQIHSFPFTGRLLASGEVSTLDLRLSDVTGHGIDLAWLRLEAKGLKLDRNVLLGSAHVRITAVDTVTVTADITEAEIRKVTGADVRLLDGKAQVSAAGVTATADVTVTGGKIRLAVAGVPALTVPVPDNALLPCAVQARVVVGAVLASCTAHQLPGIVVDAVGSVDLRTAG
jgi:hypothetical protein